MCVRIFEIQAFELEYLASQHGYCYAVRVQVLNIKWTSRRANRPYPLKLKIGRRQCETHLRTYLSTYLVGGH